ncbi:MAG: hypothetical protein HYT29_00980 [Parcubacteria group bacterium]|nr:hypothetical protein [Parcubacteria group bacterium]
MRKLIRGHLRIGALFLHAPCDMQRVSSSSPAAEKNLRAVKAGNSGLGAMLVANAIKSIRNGAALTHGPGDACGAVAEHRREALPKRIAAKPCDTPISNAVN